jgi:hypothetical protein
MVERHVCIYNAGKEDRYGGGSDQISMVRAWNMVRKMRKLGTARTGDS